MAQALSWNQLSIKLISNSGPRRLKEPGVYLRQAFIWQNGDWPPGHYMRPSCSLTTGYYLVIYGNSQDWSKWMNTLYVLHKTKSVHSTLRVQKWPRIRVMMSTLCFAVHLRIIACSCLSRGQEDSKEDLIPFLYSSAPIKRSFIQFRGFVFLQQVQNRQ